MERLPMELLLRVLGPLAPCDLIAARAVCRGWHAAVAAFEERDRSFHFPCGVTDIRHLVQTRAPYMILGEFIGGCESWDAFPCTCGAISDALDTTVFEDVADSKRDQGVTRKNAAFTCYGHRHSSSLPPATWEALARERKLAAQVLALGARVWHEVHYLQFDHSSGGGIGRYWVPCWFWLPVGAIRPSSPDEVARLVKALIKYATVYNLESSKVGDPLPRLADPDSARAFYAKPDSDDRNDSDHEDSDELRAIDHWMATWRVTANAPVPYWVSDSYKARSLRRRTRGWRQWQLDAHIEAARWRRHVSRRAASRHQASENEDEDEDMHENDQDDDQDEDNDQDEYDDDEDDEDGYTWRFTDVEVGGVEWKSLSREASITAMDQMVDALDRIQAEVNALVRHATVVEAIDGVWWMGGISPSGHLIGAMTRYSEGD